MGIHVLDGSYSKTMPSDFVSTRPVLKGGGILASYTHTHIPGPSEPSDMLMEISPDLSRSQLDDVTIFIDGSRLPHREKIYLRSIEIENHSKWIFNDYKVNQDNRRGYGTHLYVQPPAEASVIHTLPIHDTFDSLSS